MEALPAAVSLAAGILTLAVGFGCHFLGQALSLWNWPLAERLGLQDKNASPAQRDYESGTALADVLIGWCYGPIGLGLVFGWPWAFKAAIIPGILFTYHSLSFWFQTSAQNRGGRRIMAEPLRRAWAALNLASGLVVLLSAWTGE